MKGLYLSIILLKVETDNGVNQGARCKNKIYYRTDTEVRPAVFVFFYNLMLLFVRKESYCNFCSGIARNW